MCLFVQRTLIGNSDPRVDSSSRLPPYFQSELQHGRAPNIAHCSFENSASSLALVGARMISSASVVRQAAARFELGVSYSAFHTLCWWPRRRLLDLKKQSIKDI